MKVLCVGHWKTGTKSLSYGLKLLGYNVYDYEEQYIYLNDLWSKFFDGSVTNNDIFEALKDIDVLIDGPTIIFWEEIHRVFPDAKIILTIRDEDAWWKSLKNMNDKFFEYPFLRFAMLLTPTGNFIAKYGQKVFGFAHGIGSFHPLSMSWDANERLYKLKYRMHNSHVLQTVPENKLLIHRSTDGWESLCKYLNKDVPSQPYPYKNKNASLFHEDRSSSILMQKVMKEFFIVLAIFAVVIALLAYYFIAF